MIDQYSGMAKVAQKISNFSFVITAGANKGVKVGDNYLIFRLGDEIVDPDSGKSLGVLEVVVGRAKVTHLQDNFSTLESSGTERVAGSKRTIKRDGVGVLAMLGTASIEEIEEGAKVHQAKINVQVGDLARQV